MITRLTLRNFKSVGEQVYDFTQFDLLVGRNNSGKNDKDEAFHPDAGNLALAEWKRKNIENYLLVPQAWRRAQAQRGSASGYEQAVRALAELAEGYALTSSRKEFDRALRRLLVRHATRRGLMRRLTEAGLWSG